MDQWSEVCSISETFLAQSCATGYTAKSILAATNENAEHTWRIRYLYWHRAVRWCFCIPFLLLRTACLWVANMIVFIHSKSGRPEWFLANTVGISSSAWGSFYAPHMVAWREMFSVSTTHWFESLCYFKFCRLDTIRRLSSDVCEAPTPSPPTHGRATHTAHDTTVVLGRARFALLWCTSWIVTWAT